MRVISPLLKHVIYPGLSRSGYLRRTHGAGPTVVTYHGVLPTGYKVIDSDLDGNLVSAETLRRHLRLLKASYNVISPEDVLAWREGKRELPPRAVLLTCDDGLLNNLTDMLPVLQQEGMRCLFFVTGASARDERTMQWSERSRPPFDVGDTASLRRFGLLTAVELRELASAGMTIGAHTMSHPMLSQLPPELARAEMVESRAKLESVVQSRVWAFAYPFGDPGSVTPRVLAMGQDAGYAAAFLNFGGGLGTELPPYALPRVHVTSEMSIAEFEAHVSGFHGQLQRLSGREVQVAAPQGPPPRS